MFGLAVRWAVDQDSVGESGRPETFAAAAGEGPGEAGSEFRLCVLGWPLGSMLEGQGACQADAK